MISKTDTLTCDSMIYWLDKDSLFAFGNVQLTQTQQKLNAQKLSFWETDGYRGSSFIASKNVNIIGIHKGLNRLSKNDKILNNINNDITNNINQDALTLIQSIRDEAHRFAILNQRKRHNKLMFNSKLDGIPGIGDERKKIIINHFGGIQGVLKASIRDLKQVIGISEKLATNIYMSIHK